MQRFKVIGPRKIGDVATGGIVELDPDITNIDVLIRKGHIEPLPTKPAKTNTPTVVTTDGSHRAH